MSLPPLHVRFTAIKRRVREAIGPELSHEFRSSAIFQIYTGLCGEAQMAAEDDTLSEALLAQLEEYADKVIALWQATEQAKK